MGLLLLIAALVLLIVPGLFAAQATVGWIILAVLGAVLVLQVTAVATFRSTIRRHKRRIYERW